VGFNLYKDLLRIPMQAPIVLFRTRIAFDAIATTWCMILS